MNYYNENDPFAAATLRELIKANVISNGEVDERSIEDILPKELDGFKQHHFFAGFGVWSYSLRCAGWDDDEPVCTGSCPCQPYSTAGKGTGFADERHLWPSWFHLIEQRRPNVIFGEQVTAAIRHGWLDLVQDDLEGIGYAVAPHGLAACNIGAPHQRKRLYFVADSSRARTGRNPGAALGSKKSLCGAGYSDGKQGSDTLVVSGAVRGMADAEGERRGETWTSSGRSTERIGLVNGFWSDAEWIYCRDEKYRPIEPGPQQMVDGSTPSLGLVRDVSSVENEIEAWSLRHKTDTRKALRDLWHGLQSQAFLQWSSGRCYSIREAPFLLSFLRQLSDQGWRFTFGNERAGTKDSKNVLRIVQIKDASGNTPCGPGLDEQHGGKLTNPLQELSQILAYHAEISWGDPGWVETADPFPLSHGAINRVGRLRGYGNAIVAPCAQAFIEAYIESRN